MTDDVYFATNRIAASEHPTTLSDFGVASGDQCWFGKINVTPDADALLPWEDGYTIAHDTLSWLSEPLDSSIAVDAEEILSEFETARTGLRNSESAHEVLLHLHGFAADFELSLVRARQIRQAWFSDAENAHVVMFSWPANDTTFEPRLKDTLAERPEFAYDRDQQAAKDAAPAISLSLLMLLRHLTEQMRKRRAPVRLTLLAHSMGNFALMHAIQHLKSRGVKTPRTPLFDHCFLMAPDIGKDALADQDRMAPIFALCHNVHLYFAQDDRPLMLNEFLNNATDRLGLHGPDWSDDLPNHLEVIDCTDVSETVLSHGRHQYYRLVPEVIRDVRLILADEPPKRRLVEQESRQFQLLEDPDLRARDDYPPRLEARAILDRVIQSLRHP